MEELSFDKDQWMTAFRSLPKERQSMLETWFATQALIIQHVGIAEQEWFGLIGWALEHPLDFSFIDAVSTKVPEDATDATDADDKAREARLTVGGANTKNVATGPGIKEKAKAQGLDLDLYKQFMANRMNETPRGKPKPNDPRSTPRGGPGPRGPRRGKI